MRATRTLVLAAAASLVLAGCGGRADQGASASGSYSGEIDIEDCRVDPTAGIADGDPIKVGVTIAQSGPLAVLNNTLGGMQAAFNEVNAEGGIDGHEIEIVSKDDAFETSRAVANAREMIEGDQVVALVGQVGTAGIAAVQSLAETYCVPQVWTSTGSSELAADADTHPWTTAQLLMYDIEAQLWFQALENDFPDGGKISLITNTDDRGKVYEAAVAEVAKDSSFEVVSVQRVDVAATNVDSQVSGALVKRPDVVLAATDGGKCPLLFRSLDRAGFEGRVLAGNVCSSVADHFEPAGESARGVQVLTYVVDPGNPAVKSDPALEPYLESVSKVSGAEPKNSYTAMGYQIGHLVAANLEAASELDGGVNRANFMNAAWTTDTTLPLTPGDVETHLDFAEDPLWRDTVQLMEYAEGKGLLPVGDPISLD